MDPSQNPMIALGQVGSPPTPNQQMPLGATADPRSQYLAMALAQNINKSGQNPGNMPGLAADLLAQALAGQRLQGQAQNDGYYIDDQGQRVANPGPIPGGSAGGTYVPPQPQPPPF
jgi:hypothetical protein